MYSKRGGLQGSGGVGDAGAWGGNGRPLGASCSSRHYGTSCASSSHTSDFHVCVFVCVYVCVCVCVCVCVRACARALVVSANLS